MRVVRNVHFAIESGDRAVGVDDRGAIVIDALGAMFEDRRDDHDTQFACDRAQQVGGRTGDRLGQVMPREVFFLTEILRGKKLLQADHLRALPGSLPNARDSFFAIGGYVR